jgi:hypothetical protein
VKAVDITGGRLRLVIDGTVIRDNTASESGDALFFLVDNNDNYCLSRTFKLHDNMMKQL